MTIFPNFTIPGWLLNADTIEDILYDAVEALWDFADGPSSARLETFVAELRQTLQAHKAFDAAHHA